MDKKILYCAVVLSESSRQLLLNTFGKEAPSDWKWICHHATICFGHGLVGEMKYDLGKEITLKVTHIGKSNMAMAVVVDGIKSDNAVPHITLCVNESAGGKPKMSNDITNWEPISQIVIYGIISKIKG